VERKAKLSVIIITRDEEEMISDCLKSALWADEIILIDTGSKDKTIPIAEKMGARAAARLEFKGYDFSGWRNRGLKEARGDWVLYLDADERITPLLKKEILEILNRQRRFSVNRFPTAFAIPRRNFYLGKEMNYGGAWLDYVQRLFLKKSLQGWKEKLHEYPEFQGEMGKLKNPLIHLTHRDLGSMMVKTIDWTEIEAELLDRSGHPPVKWWRILRMMATKFWERVIKQQAWRDGSEGWINAVFEIFNTFIIYARLWEIQKNKKFSS
jgi:(heptosyl)LPS beta-1,4-glucosyltransferase